MTQSTNQQNTGVQNVLLSADNPATKVLVPAGPGGVTRLAARRVHKPQSQRGFTLIETMVVVAVTTILVFLGMPDMSQFLNGKRAEDAARRIAEDLALGRNEAVKRNSSVMICAQGGADCGTAADWSQGWRICYDADRNGICDATMSDDPNPVHTQSAIVPAVEVTGPASRLRFNADGTLSSTDYTQFTVKTARGRPSTWTVRIAPSGAVSLRRG
jgi:prepilin-type N-terminal cleavage/methylation domain-containing protein